MKVYYGSGEEVQWPSLKKSIYTKDFSWGFYCTESETQAKRYALRMNMPYVTTFNYERSNNINIKQFEAISDEWLDFVVYCRQGNVHDYDIVEGPMIDETIRNYVEDFMDGTISREAFFLLTELKNPAWQISFHSIRALECLEFERSVFIG